MEVSVLSKKVAIVGAGPGGLTAGMLLAHQGYQVEIYEKNPHVGGRNARLTVGDFHFDTGPTFLMLPEVLDDVFRFAGRDLNQYLEMKKIDPLYRLRFKGKDDFFPSRDLEYMLEQIERLFPGDAAGYKKYLEKEKIKFDHVFRCLKLPYYRLIHLLRPPLIKALPYLNLGQTLYQKLGGYFQHEEMRVAMTFQSKYLGMSPWKCPAAFTILSYIEHSRGVLHPIGGLNRISAAMAKVVEEDGGTIHLNSPVAEIIVKGGQATGLRLENGEEIVADYVIINADFASAMTKLVAPEHRHKYTDADLHRRDYSCSTFMLYLGLDKVYDINHHNIIFANDYRKNVEEIAETKVLSSDPSIYLQNASRIDPSLAPEGKSTMYVLVPVPNNSSGIDWDTETLRFRELILDQIERKTELQDIRQHIVAEKIITPKDWEHEYGIYKGATFNLSHKITQMLYFRPHNRFEEFKNCYLTGGGTHPGSGLPTIYESGRIAANMILQDGKGGLDYNYHDIFDENDKK
jgi:phytoene desaturase